MGANQSLNKYNLKKLKCNAISLDKLLPWINSLSSELINNTALIDDYHVDYGLIHWIYESRLSEFDKYHAIVICLVNGANPFKVFKIIEHDFFANDAFYVRTYKIENKDLDEKLYKFIVAYYAGSHDNYINENLCKLVPKDDNVLMVDFLQKYNSFVEYRNPIDHDYCNL